MNSEHTWEWWIVIVGKSTISRAWTKVLLENIMAVTFCSGLKVVPLFVPNIKAMTELCLPLALPYNCLIIPYLPNRPAFFNYVFWFLGEHENKDFPIIKYGWNIIHRRVVDLNNNSHETEKYWTIMLRTWIHSKIRRSSRKGKKSLWENCKSSEHHFYVYDFELLRKSRATNTQHNHTSWYLTGSSGMRNALYSRFFKMMFIDFPPWEKLYQHCGVHNLLNRLLA